MIILQSVTFISKPAMTPTAISYRPVAYKKPNTYNKLLSLFITSCILVLTGCQTTQHISADSSSIILATEHTRYPDLLQLFNIRGKIGVTTPHTDTNKAQSGSAFYVWAQEDDRFAIDITGALGIGHTIINYNGTTATLVSERTGKISAKSPEDLLLQATGWQAPISQLRYWISGRPAPSDLNIQLDQIGRLVSSQNGDWTASFEYSANTASSQRPSKIKALGADGYRVIMTIEHAK